MPEFVNAGRHPLGRYCSRNRDARMQPFAIKPMGNIDAEPNEGISCLLDVKGMTADFINQKSAPGV